MNKKGFTLIELLAVIILIGLAATLIMPTAIKSLKDSKQKSYDIFIENVKTASENYYMECESESSNIPCSISSSNTLTTTLGDLARYGFLKGTSVENNSSVLNVLDPRNNTNLNDCSIKITKTVSTARPSSNTVSSKKVTYSVSKNDARSECPTSY